MYNTRIAPSPTGDMHIGTARTAYFNWLAARSTGGKFLLRIDDTDKERSNEVYTDLIKTFMDWLGLDYDSCYKQSDRILSYREALDVIPHKTLENGAVALDLQSFDGLPTSWTDEISGEIKITQQDLDQTKNMILFKADGLPTYNFASVIDDIDGGINYIIRGTDHITNTAKQAILFRLFNADLPKFAHVGLINKDGKPLSKRDGGSSLIYYKNSCYDPDAMLNFMARMGWGPTVDDKTTSLLPREKMLELFFKGGSMRNQAANLDLAKLQSFDRKYKGRKQKCSE